MEISCCRSACHTDWSACIPVFVSIIKLNYSVYSDNGCVILKNKAWRQTDRSQFVLQSLCIYLNDFKHCERKSHSSSHATCISASRFFVTCVSTPHSLLTWEEKNAVNFQMLRCYRSTSSLSTQCQFCGDGLLAHSPLSLFPAIFSSCGEGGKKPFMFVPIGWMLQTLQTCLSVDLPQEGRQAPSPSFFLPAWNHWLAQFRRVELGWNSFKQSSGWV